MRLSDFDAATNLVSLFFLRADKLGDKPFLWAKREGRWHSISWRVAASQVCLIAENLRALGLRDGDRIALISENRPEWCIADLAIMAAGCISVPTYTTNTERDHVHILDNSGARCVIVSSDKLARPIVPAMIRTGIAEHLIGMEPLRRSQAAFGYHDWEEMLRGDAEAARRAVEERISHIARADSACIIYTSGTGGAPRGVPQHHGAILANVAGCAHIFEEDFSWEEDETFLSFLPLSHSYEHTGGQFLAIGLGAQTYYAEGLEKLASNIEEAKPTIMVVVPRLFEVLRSRIMKQMEKQGRTAVWLMDQALAVNARSRNGRPRLRDWPLDRLVDRLLRPKIRQRFGGRIKALVSGGAPLNPDVGNFFTAMGLTLLQGYGQTEAAPVISCGRPGVGLKMDTVGPPLRGVEVRIAEDGEILTRGECVMHGYWQNPEQTALTLQDGWLHTGDIGHFDEKGRLVITDRKKDMIVNDKGDNIAPQKIEGMLTLQPEIAQAMVSGDRRPYVVGLLVPDAEWALQWAQANDEKFDLAALQQLPAFRSAIRAAVDRVNQDLSVIEKVRQFAFADEAFSIENEQMTPSLKIRRHKLREKYGERLDGLYKS
ncbi:long-chain fatty acid--CoA ligase [Tsuneonella sp. CC-YZS046]|uniref:AMP-dependent synthetase/ligase n=1 Tax=Tsuneonella sp. CC-YZS046 TaxID=3042152 RepID=UPI002D77B301|nr:long-chain fatty acid--CoA ligase [Tsuneonella sp. CC-YZS046]WRO65997.1 long-chain fatty acid--CoA ligase [Tsuneonella sp. CC-YZS046]